MLKNTASQKIALFAFIPSTSLPKTGDAANITPYLSKDGGSVTALTDTSATEMSSTNAPGWYLFDVTQSESNANDILFTGKSTTSDVSVIGQPVTTVEAATLAEVINAILDAMSLQSDTAQAGAAGTITLVATASSTNDYYVGAMLYITSGTGAGQPAVRVTAYNGTTKVATITPNFLTTPSSTSVYVLAPALTSEILARIPSALVGGRIDASVGALNGVAASAANLERSASVIYRGAVTGAASTTTLIDSGLTQSGTNHWVGRVVIFTSGTLASQATTITAFTPASDTLTFGTMTGTPAGADTYVIV